MTTTRTRIRPVLVGLVCLLALIVALDRAALPAASSPDGPIGSNDSARSRYLHRAALAQSDRTLIRQAGEWRLAAERAVASWTGIRQRLIAAPTTELALARLRDLVIAELRSIELQGVRAVRAPASTDDSDSLVIRELALDVEFDAPDHRRLYIALDRLERLDGLLLRIESISVRGPGRAQVPRVLSVSLRLIALEIRSEEAPT